MNVLTGFKNLVLLQELFFRKHKIINDYNDNGNIITMLF